MANFGQAALTVVGAAIGAVAGYYTGDYQLIFVGASLGNLAGQLAFPTKPGPGPDVHVMGASEGDPIRMVLGTARIPGTVIWAGPITQSSSGKGISPSSQTAKYNQSFAVQLCVGPIVGVRKIWMDSGLVYDISNPSNGAAMVASEILAGQMSIYLGDESQTPDGTMESYLGAGNVPAHRGTAYIVFIGFDITKYGPRIPNIEVEVVQNGVASSSSTTLYAGPVVAPWVQHSNDPRAASATVTAVLSDGTSITGPITPQYTYSAGTVSNGTLAQALAQVGNPGFYSSWTYFVTTGNEPGTCPFRAQSDGGAPQIGQPQDSVSLALSYNFYSALDYQWTYPKSLGWFLDSEANAGSLAQYSPGTPAFWVVSSGNNGTICGFTQVTGPSGTVNPSNNACIYPSDPPAPAPISLPYFATVWTGVHYSPPGYGVAPACPGDIIYTISLRDDIAITVQRAQQAPPNRCAGQPGLPGASGYCIIGGEVEQDTNWVLTSGSFRQLTTGRQAGVSIPNSLWRAGWNTTTQSQTCWTVYPQGPVQPVGAENDTQAWWTAQFNAALSSGRLPSSCAGWVYGVDYPNNVSSAYKSVQPAQSLTPIPITVGTAVATICGKCGMSSGQYDVSQLTDELWGYVITRVGPGRDAITPLQSYGFFDAAVGSTGALRFVKRGGTPVATLTEDNIGAVKDRQGQGTRLTTPRTADLELPQLVRVRFANTWNDYQAGMQPAQRLITTSKVVADVDLSGIAMDPDAAAQIGDVFLRATWIGREEPAFAIPSDWLGTIQPADAILLNISGVTRRVRVKELNYSWPGLLTVTAEREESDAYVSIAVGSTTGTSGNGTSSSPQSGSLTPSGPANILPLDIPVLRTADNQAGYYAAVYPLLSSAWEGAGIYRSLDGGESYTEETTVSQMATIGTTVNALGAWPPGLDPKNNLHLKLTAGTPPASISEATFFNTGNVFAVGAAGRWEIIQAQTSALQSDGSYILSTLLRGLLGTEWAINTHQTGDTVVMLTGNVVRINDNIGSKGSSELLKAVASGTALQTATAESITPAEVCLTPLAPRCFRAGRNAAGDVVFQWIRQDRLANDLVPNTPIPMSEAVEAYTLSIYTSNSYATVKRTISASTGTATYTAAQQIADFGALVASGAGYAQVAQLSALVGAGYTTKLNF